MTVAGAIFIGSSEEASIGGALLLGIVALLGLPWSVAVFLVEDGLDGDAASAASYAASAILNGALMLWFARSVTRRRRP